jgi:hypothetical protein
MLDPKEEKRFEELRGMCRELKVPALPEIMIGLKVHDKNGILTFDDVQRGHSWLRHFWDSLFMACSSCTGTGSSVAAGNMVGVRFDGAIYTAYSSSGMGASVGDGNGSGLKVGTSDTAFSVNHYALQAEIANGNGSGQLLHSTTTSGGVAVYTGGAKTWSATISRIFNNNSGASITVKETGLMNYGCPFNNTNNFYIERSVLSPTVAVANGAQLTVTYEISMDFSAID